MAPILISHMGQFPATTISFNLAPSASLGAAVKAIQKVEKDCRRRPAMQGSFQGTAQAFVGSLTNEPLLILSALVTVYIVLGVLYESYIHPITILSTLPSAGVGALLALIVCRQRAHVVAIIGIVLLIGIVQKNAIMMIDFALEAERQEHKKPLRRDPPGLPAALPPDPDDHDGGAARGRAARPRQGVGSELRRPLGITIIGGLIFSQLLTLYTTPVIYLFFDELAAKFAARRRPKPGGRRRDGRARPRRPADEPLLPLHPPADRDHAPHRGGRPRRAVVAFPAPAGLAAAPGRLPDDLGQASLPGASPEIMASSVATPLEREFGRIAGVTEMTAQSTLGQTSVTLQFDLSRNIDAAARDVEAAINAARSNLPTDLRATRPTGR
jgi:multidrug efflux pump subunit AcrB